MSEERRGSGREPRRRAARSGPGYPETAGSLLAERIRSDEEGRDGGTAEGLKEPAADDI